MRRQCNKMNIAKLRASALHLQPVNAIRMVWLSKVMEVQGPQENKARLAKMLANAVNLPNSSPSNKAMQITRQYDGIFEIADIRCASTTRKCARDGWDVKSDRSIKPTRKYAYGIRLAVTPVVLNCYA